MPLQRGWLAIAGGLTCVLLLTAVPASAEILAGIAVDRDVHRFPGDADENRLEGSATGWMLLGGTTLFSHLTLRVEDAHGGDIVHPQTFSVDVGGKALTIESSFTHRVRSTAGLGGFSHQPWSRIRLTYLAGLSSISVRRTFVTNAPPLVLVTPDVSHAFEETTTTDFWSLVLGADLIFHLAPHVAVVAGIRWQQLKLDETGTSLRPLVGGLWVF